MNESVTRFNQLMAESRKKVYNHAYSLAKNQSDAEDLVQSAYVKAWLNFEHFNESKSFLNWIFRIVTNLYLDLVRTKNARIRAESYDALEMDAEDFEEAASTELNPEEQLFRGLYSDKLKLVLSELPADQLKLLVMSDILEMSNTEIAQILGCKAGPLKFSKYHLHLKLRKQLA